MKTKHMLGSAVAFLAAVSTAWSASLLDPGTVVSPLGPPFDVDGGTVIPGASMTTPFSGGGISGILSALVVANDPVNPNVGGVSFAYTLQNTSATEALGRLTISGWDKALNLYVGYAPPGGTTTAPSSVNRSAGVGTTIGFDFLSNPLLPGATSGYMMIYSPWPTWTVGGASVIDSGVVSFQTLVPEPTTYAAMFGLGLLGFAAWRRVRA